jgi:hypothetical protein
MPGLGTVTVVGLVVLAVLVWFFLRARSQDMLAEMMAKRKPSSKVVSRANYVEGLETIPVAVALTGDTFYYENPDLQASFELKNVDEVEYVNELATGHPIEHGKRALRLRSHGTTFEFVLGPADSNMWESLLPPRRMGQGTARAS